ncbi:hypothetical protein D3C76_1356030 [compost metagenome]
MRAIEAKRLCRKQQPGRTTVCLPGDTAGPGIGYIQAAHLPVNQQRFLQAVREHRDTVQAGASRDYSQGRPGTQAGLIPYQTVQRCRYTPGAGSIRAQREDCLAAGNSNCRAGAGAAADIFRSERVMHRPMRTSCADQSGGKLIQVAFAYRNRPGTD